MNASQYEGLIVSLSRRYGESSGQIEYLDRLGRVTVFKLLEKNSDIDPSTISSFLERKFQSVIFDSSSKISRDLVSITSDLDSQVRTSELSSLCTFNDILRKRFGREFNRAISEKDDSQTICRGITRTLIEKVYRIPINEIPDRVNYELFRKSGIVTFLWAFYKNSAFRAVIDAYPDEVIPWKFKKKPNGFWRGKYGYERAKDAMKWFCSKNGINSVEDCSGVDTSSFISEGLGGLLEFHFNSSPYLALKSVFPNLKPWKIGRAPKGYYKNKNNQIEAILGYLMDNFVPTILEYNPEEVYETGLRVFVCKDDMNKYGLRGLLAKYSGNVYKMFCELFPGKILPWTLNSVKEPWRKNPKETGARAIRWLFDSYLMISQKEIPYYATDELFWRVGFSGIMTNRSIGFNSSPYIAINSAYPGVFQKEDFKRSRWDRLPKLNISNLKRNRI